MRGLTKLGFALLLVFSFSLIALAAELLFLLRRRHLRRSRPADPEIAGGGFLCGKNRSRVEPAVAAITPSAKPPPPQAAAEEEEEEGDLASWRTMYLGPSRVLYTIEEEEAESGGDDDLESETPFYTPSSSPPRAVEEVLVSSRSDRKMEISVLS
ncbi:uncharacterized protein [Typha angustifolia]|uniref:uncharacterized protein n=1 Tax=Typha angustifolia TaxID=59011 RepID=UPI003C2F2C94